MLVIFKDYIRGKQLYSRIKLSQAGFGDHLIEKGVVPNKSLILTFPAENIVKKGLVLIAQIYIIDFCLL